MLMERSMRPVYVQVYRQTLQSVYPNSEGGSTTGSWLRGPQGRRGFDESIVILAGNLPAGVTIPPPPTWDPVAPRSSASKFDRWCADSKRVLSNPVRQIECQGLYCPQDREANHARTHYSREHHGQVA